jgi:predicted nucleotidyltransferase component of viral defense system
MSRPDPPPIRAHEDAALFREALRYTAAETGFVARLVERDYFCTVLLQHLTGEDASLVFKGGTCLAKVHSGFYRLSEDLDFAISTPAGSSRSARQARIEPLKRAIAATNGALPSFRLRAALTGANNSTQYCAIVQYVSLATGEDEPIKVEISLREPVMEPGNIGQAATMLIDPVTRDPMIPVLSVPCLSLTEAMAEKARAALTRRDPAIRDFFDIDYAVRQRGFDVAAPELQVLLRRKLQVAGTGAADVSSSRLTALRLQAESHLRPVLRPEDFGEFDVNRAFATVARLAAALA